MLFHLKELLHFEQESYILNIRGLYSLQQSFSKECGCYKYVQDGTENVNWLTIHRKRLNLCSELYTLDLPISSDYTRRMALQRRVMMNLFHVVTTIRLGACSLHRDAIMQELASYQLSP